MANTWILTNSVWKSQIWNPEDKFLGSENLPYYMIWNFDTNVFKSAVRNFCLTPLPLWVIKQTLLRCLWHHRLCHTPFCYSLLCRSGCSPVNSGKTIFAVWRETHRYRNAAQERHHRFKNCETQGGLSGGDRFNHYVYWWPHLARPWM